MKILPNGKAVCFQKQFTVVLNNNLITQNLGFIVIYFVFKRVSNYDILFVGVGD